MATERVRDADGRAEFHRGVGVVDRLVDAAGHLGHRGTPAQCLPSTAGVAEAVGQFDVGDEFGPAGRVAEFDEGSSAQQGGLGDQVPVLRAPRRVGHRGGQVQPLGSAAGSPRDVVCGEQRDRQGGRVVGRAGQLDRFGRGSVGLRGDRPRRRVAACPGERRQHPRPQRGSGPVGRPCGEAVGGFGEQLDDLASVSAGTAALVVHPQSRTGQRGAVVGGPGRVGCSRVLAACGGCVTGAVLCGREGEQ